MAAEFILGVGRGEVTEQTRMTVAEFLNVWDKRYVSSLKGRTTETYGQIMRCHLVPELGPIQLSKLTPLTIQEYFTSKAAVTLQDTGSVPVTVIQLTPKSKITGPGTLRVGVRDDPANPSRQAIELYRGKSLVRGWTFRKGPGVGVDNAVAAVQSDPGNIWVTATKVADGNGTLAAIAKPEEHKPSLAANTIHSHYRVLHSALKCAVDWGMLTRNPCDKIRRPKRRRVIKRVPTEKELALFFEAARTYRAYPVFLLAVCTGLRQSELLGLRWSDVDFDGETVTVRQAVQRGGRKPVFDEPKTDAGTRVVTLPEIGVGILRWHRDEQQAERSLKGAEYVDHDLVFPTSNGTPILRRNLARCFSIVMKRAGLGNAFTFRELRHTHVSLLVIRGVPLEALSKRLGHSSPQVTREVYTHIPQETQREIARVTEGLMHEVLDQQVH